MDFRRIENKPRIEEVMESEGVTLLRSTGTSFKAHCPFHTDKNPSMLVNTDGQTFYCFSCLERGDVIDFIRVLKDIDFKEAIRYLGVTPGERYEPSPEEVAQRAAVKEREYLILEWKHILADACREMHVTRKAGRRTTLTMDRGHTLIEITEDIPWVEYRLDILFGNNRFAIDRLLEELRRYPTDDITEKRSVAFVKEEFAKGARWRAENSLCKKN